jgi:hypothetical protein
MSPVAASFRKVTLRVDTAETDWLLEDTALATRRRLSRRVGSILRALRTRFSLPYELSALLAEEQTRCGFQAFPEYLQHVAYRHALALKAKKRRAQVSPTAAHEDTQ